MATVTHRAILVNQQDFLSPARGYVSRHGMQMTCVVHPYVCVLACILIFFYRCIYARKYMLRGPSVDGDPVLHVQDGSSAVVVAVKVTMSA